MSNKFDTYYTLFSNIREVTPLLPVISFLGNSLDFNIFWEGTIPDEKTISRIKEVLRDFGTPIPDYRRKNYVSFTVLR